MCSCDSSDGPEAFTSTVRTARKAHRCCECSRAIAPGDRYEYASGIWDGSAGSYKTCLRCVGLRAAHVEAEEHVQGVALSWAGRHAWPVEPCRPVFGELVASIGECAREEGRIYVEAFRRARRGQQAGDQGGSK